MEGQTKFQTALKKTVVMFKTLTGKELTEEEGSIFINLLDMTEGYQSLITTGTSGMVVSVGQAGNISVAPVTAGQVYHEKQGEIAERPDTPPLKGLPEEFQQDRESFTADINLYQRHPKEVLTKTLRLPANPDLDAYTPPPITTNKRDHIQGYDWQIIVLSRVKDPSDCYVVHFAYQPTQEQFEEHFAKFVARTHYVHVNEWHRGDREWVGITNIKYDTAHLLKAEHEPRWEQDDMAYRIRYYDRETGALTFKYVPRKPSGNGMATYHHTKGFATVQSKVA